MTAHIFQIWVKSVKMTSPWRLPFCASTITITVLLSQLVETKKIYNKCCRCFFFLLFSTNDAVVFVFFLFSPVMNRVNIFQKFVFWGKIKLHTHTRMHV
jgi:hypothetical protein